MDVIDRVKELIAKYLEENAIELVEITYRREQPGMVLRLLVDKEGGITIAECEELNNHLSEALDKEDIISDRYLLEVSSPGLDRPMKTDRDFERAMGKVLDITTYERIDDRKTHEGKLVGMDRENVVIESNGLSTVIPRAKIARAVLKVEI
ncbi:MAG: ribosome maturation factor RimP [Candidatus Omnitrophota bacterium]